MADGFLRRWSQRKEAVRKGEAVEAEPAHVPPPPPPPQKNASVFPGTPEASPRGGGSKTEHRLPLFPEATGSQSEHPLPLAGEGRGGGEFLPPPLGEGRGGGTAHQARGGTADQPPPTLEDTQSLTPTSDFTPYLRPDVPPDVKNAALKKLFADPHFNLMDGLDVYIDDYSKPDPLPPEMLAQLASAKFLKLFQQKEGKDPDIREGSDDPVPGSVAQSPTAANQAVARADPDADPDLRLQQDHAPGRRGAGEGPE